MVQAFLKVDEEWVSLLLYETRYAALAGLHKLQRLEPDPKHLLRVKKWNGFENVLFTRERSEEVIMFPVASVLIAA